MRFKKAFTYGKVMCAASFHPTNEPWSVGSGFREPIFMQYTLPFFNISKWFPGINKYHLYAACQIDFA